MIVGTMVPGNTLIKIILSFDHLVKGVIPTLGTLLE